MSLYPRVLLPVCKTSVTLIDPHLPGLETRFCCHDATAQCRFEFEPKEETRRTGKGKGIGESSVAGAHSGGLFVLGPVVVSTIGGSVDAGGGAWWGVILCGPCERGPGNRATSSCLVKISGCASYVGCGPLLALPRSITALADQQIAIFG